MNSLYIILYTLVLYVDIAEWVLNKCALSRQPASNDENDEKTSRVENKNRNDERTHNQGRHK